MEDKSVARWSHSAKLASSFAIVIDHGFLSVYPCSSFLSISNQCKVTDFCIGEWKEIHEVGRWGHFRAKKTSASTDQPKYDTEICYNFLPLHP